MNIDEIPLYRNKQGEPIGFREWATFYENISNRIIGQEYVDRWFISTVWTGILTNMFETMIFTSKECPFNDMRFDDWMQRYDTLEEAVEGHKQAVQMCKNHINSPIIYEEKVPDERT